MSLFRRAVRAERDPLDVDHETLAVPPVPEAQTTPVVDPAPIRASDRREAPPAPASSRYRLDRRIGAGNHGVVFAAHDRHLGRDVALKRFSHYLADDPRAMRRITREVEALARVRHRNVVTVHDLVSLPDGDGELVPHLVMELVEGTSVRELLQTHGPSPHALAMVRGVLDGLEACHRAGIVHLDIKPGNVLVGRDGAVTIVDFGIARAASDATATVAGTPHYMAPEQYDGRSDARSDLYAVGCMLYECLTGRPPFDGTAAVQLLAHRERARPDARSAAPWVPGALAAVVQRAMAVDPAERFGDVAAMRVALDTAVAGLDLEQWSPQSSDRPPSLGSAPGAHRPGPVERGAPGPVAAADEPVARVTRGGRLLTLLVGSVLSAFVLALVPGLVWATIDLAPAAARPSFMAPAEAEPWWMVAVAGALIVLMRRRHRWLGDLAGPPVGDPEPGGLVPHGTRRGIRTAAWAAALGAIPLLLPWYLTVLEAGWIATTGGPSLLDRGVAEPGWLLCWSLAPAVALLVLWRAVRGVRPRLGAVLTSTALVAVATLLAAGFVAGALVVLA